MDCAAQPCRADFGLWELRLQFRDGDVGLCSGPRVRSVLLGVSGVLTRGASLVEAENLFRLLH